MPTRCINQCSAITLHPVVILSIVSAVRNRKTSSKVYVDGSALRSAAMPTRCINQCSAITLHPVVILSIISAVRNRKNDDLIPSAVAACVSLGEQKLERTDWQWGLGIRHKVRDFKSSSMTGPCSSSAEYSANYRQPWENPETGIYRKDSHVVYCEGH